MESRQGQTSRSTLPLHAKEHFSNLRADEKREADEQHAQKIDGPIRVHCRDLLFAPTAGWRPETSATGLSR